MLSKSKQKNIISIIVLVFFLVLAVGSSDGGSSINTSSGPDKMDAWFMAQNFVEDRLKAPSTADFPSYSESYVTELAGDKFQVEGYVDAENSFGAKIRTDFEVTVKYVGDDKWRLKSINTW